jgi:DNA-binding beta-propeller fold protein YncE
LQKLADLANLALECEVPLMFRVDYRAKTYAPLAAGQKAAMSAVLAVIVVLAGILASAKAAQTPDTASCNQPAHDAVTWIDLPGQLPFQALPSTDGCWIFVSLATGNGEAGDNEPKGGVALIKRSAGHMELVRVIHVGGNPTGMVLTHDGQLLVVADGNRVAFLDTQSLISGDEAPVLGYWTDGVRAPEHVYVNVTSDDKYLFVSDENAHTITVVRLPAARGSKHFKPTAVGKIPVGDGPVAVTFSPDERYLYITTITMPLTKEWPAECVREWDPKAKPNAQGAIFIVDVARATSDTGNAVVRVAKGGCSPVRLVLSPKGDTAYVTARGGNALLIFDTHKLIADPNHALLGKVPTGSAPIGIAVVDAGKKVIVTNSNRFEGSSSETQSLLVIDAAKIADGENAILGTIPARGLPREMRTTSDGRTLLVVNTKSQKLQILDLERLSSQVSHAGQ